MSEITYGVPCEYRENLEKKLKEKYKDNPPLLNQKMAELFNSDGVSIYKVRVGESENSAVTYCE